MSYDLYVELGGESQNDVKAIVDGNYRNFNISDIATRIRLLGGIAARNKSVRDYTVSGDRRSGGGYKSLIHGRQPGQTRYARQIEETLKTFNWLKPSVPVFESLPNSFWFLQFTFALAKPWISKDDDIFYVAESVNPVRKDKVFKIPVMSAAAWKGLLRWTMMHIRLAIRKDHLSPEKFACERLAQTLLFGDEKGEEPGKTGDFAAYLDELGGSEGRKQYEQMVRARFGLSDNDPLPHYSGRLMFYPTFFDQIDVEVINPHKRQTRAGTHPIYMECVPARAQGTFSLLYVPFDLIGQADAGQQAQEDLQRVAEAVREMMLTYGFSAKRTSGYGTAKDKITGVVRTRDGECKVSRLSRLAEEVQNARF